MLSIPSELLKSLSHSSGFDEEKFVQAHQEENLLTSIRLNPFKLVDLDFSLDEKVNWNEEGFYLNQRPSFTLDPLFHAGAYYVQEAGSMFLEFVLKQKINFNQALSVLDLCAAPGGKTTLINSLLNQESLLLANEVNKSRATILAHNLSKWGTCNTIVSNADVSKFSGLNNFFDLVVVDAPCSGSGLFRKQPEAINEWSLNHVQSCSMRQKEILTQISSSVKENGFLFYSTCSYSKQENENIVEWLVNTGEFEFEKLKIPKEWQIVESNFGYQFYPHLVKSEGFFCALLRKIKSSLNTNEYHKKEKVIPVIIESQILESINITTQKAFEINSHFHLGNNLVFDFWNKFQKHFYFKKVGTSLGQLKGKDFVPNQELAYSNYVSTQVSKFDLSHSDALLLLRKRELQIFENKNGLHLFTYKNLGLCFGKILKSRINNYLPNELRILK